MSGVHALAAGYLLAFILLLAYLLRHVTKLSRLECQLDTVEQQLQAAPQAQPDAELAPRPTPPHSS